VEKTPTYSKDPAILVYSKDDELGSALEV